MAKRFTDTNKYRKPFIRGLKGAYKLLWDYLYHDCDHAGIWIVDFEIAQLYLGADMLVNKQDALKYFNEGEIRILEFDGGKKWFVIPFIEFQYGILNEQNRVHLSVINALKKNNIDKGLISTLQGAKDKDMDKDKDKDNNKKIVFDFVKPEYKEAFETWIEYKMARNEKYKNQKSLEACYNKLIKLSSGNPVAALEIINNSMANNWAGLFPLKKDKTDEVPYKLKITTGAFSR